jgi:hypothetical protein
VLQAMVDVTPLYTHYISLMLLFSVLALIKNDENLIKNLTHSCKGEFNQKNKLMVCTKATGIEERGSSYTVSTK